MYAQESIDLLSRSGINFQKFEEFGIDLAYFGELFTTSGIVYSDRVTWISFHSGYDFGYLMHLLLGTPLPQGEVEFFELMKICFPVMYDIKHLMKSCKDLKGGLNDLAEQLEVARIGPQHQAGSDSLLTSAVFFKLRQLYFDNVLEKDKFTNIIFGLSSGRVQYPGNHHNVDVSGDNTYIAPYNM